MSPTRLSFSRNAVPFPLYSLLITAVFLCSCVLPVFADRTMRVGLTSSIGRPQSVTISCSGSFRIAQGDSNPLKIAAGQPVTFTMKDGGIQILSGNTPTAARSTSVRITPDDVSAKFFIISPKARSPYYRHTLEISASRGLLVVNELPLEEYVRGVIPVEIPKKFHPEAQKALSVAIRTYAVNSRRHAAEGFDVCDSVHCQVFCGATREGEWIDSLIDATRGKIATYNGKPISTTYSTDCGGMTQSASFGGKPVPYLQSVGDRPPTGSTVSQQPDDYCSKSGNHVWQKVYTASELQSVFSSQKDICVGNLQLMEFSEYDSSGRVKIVVIKGDKGEARITGNRLRQMLGADRLKSTMVTLTMGSNGEYIINGKGYGHGMGMCSYGADGLARSRPGVTYEDILRHYYRGVEITALSDSNARVGP